MAAFKKMFPAVSLLRDEGSHSVSHVEIVNKRVSGHFPRMKHTRAWGSGGKISRWEDANFRGPK